MVLQELRLHQPNLLNLNSYFNKPLHADNDRTGECERIINGQPFCEQNAVLERLKIDVTVGNDGACSDWSFADSDENRVRLMEDWCSSANAHHNAAMEFYTDGSLLVANGDSAQASFDKGDFISQNSFCSGNLFCIAFLESFNAVTSLADRSWSRAIQTSEGDFVACLFGLE